MHLLLRNRYPFPYPQNLPTSENDQICDAANKHWLRIDGIVGIEWLHDLSIEFEGLGPMLGAQQITGWKRAGNYGYHLHAQTSRNEGYDNHPAIITKQFAWCGFMLVKEDQLADGQKLLDSDKDTLAALSVSIMRAGWTS
jgi:hypothetical protein